MIIMNCVFCKIVKKEIPAEIVYEDKEILGFKNVQTRSANSFITHTQKTH